MVNWDYHIPKMNIHFGLDFVCWLSLSWWLLGPKSKYRSVMQWGLLMILISMLAVENLVESIIREWSLLIAHPIIMNIINVLNNDNYILIDFCWFVGRFDINSNSKSNSNGNSDINASTDDICVNEQRIINLIKNNNNNTNSNSNEVKKNPRSCLSFRFSLELQLATNEINNKKY